MKEFWSFHTVKRSLYAPSLIDFNHWLEDKVEAHERMRPSSNYNKNQNNSVRTKTNVKMFAQTRKLSLTQIFNIVHV